MLVCSPFCLTILGKRSSITRRLATSAPFRGVPLTGTWTVRIPALVCPSDEELTQAPFGNNSYKMCLGTTVLNNHTDDPPEPNGIAVIRMTSPSATMVRLRDVLDGSSNTIAMSESRIGNYEGTTRLALSTPVSFTPGRAHAQLAKSCVFFNS